jgi:uncharacterized protein (DUF885 family)
MVNSATNTPEFECWLDDFFCSYYRHRPVNATFIGVHDYDASLPDYSETGLADTLADMQSMLQQLRQLPPEPLSRAQRIDRQLCEGHLRIQCWEYEQDHVVRGNPSLYVGEAIFGVLALFLTDYAPLFDRVAAAAERLSAIPDLLRQGRENLRQAPTEWVTLALAECRGALEFLSSGALLAPGQEITNRYKEGVERATQAFNEFASFLDEDLESVAQDRNGCGEEVLSLHLRYAHCLDKTADEIVQYAEEQMAAAAQYLDQHCADFEGSNRDEVLAGLRKTHPAIDRYYDRYQEIWDDMRRIAEKKGLITWPEFPIRYVPQPEWARTAATDLYFLFYRSPAAFNRPPIHEYLVTPIDASMPDNQQLLRATNDSVIKLNHVVHHGGIGHHIQNWHAFRSRSRVGKIAAIDCASRIAMNCGGTMAEGWACYATDLMAEAGGLSAREIYAEHQTRTRMCARAIVEIRLHQGYFSFAQAVDFYVQNAAMSRESAIYETTRNSMYPGFAVMYLTGCDAIHELRKTLSAHQGSRFNLRDFHDQFLSYGSIPVALIARAMLEEEDRDTAHQAPE